MERKFASPDERLRSLVARERQMPGLLEEARVNLKNPPHIYTEIAIEQLPGIVHFFENDVPAAFTDAKDPALKEEFAHSNAAVIAALNGYLAWIKSDLLPRSNGDFRIGADTFSKKLAIRRDGRYAARQAARDRLGRSAQESGALRSGGARNSSRTRTRTQCSKNWAPCIPRRTS